MTRRRYRYDPESGEMVEIGATLPPRRKDALNHMSALWGDRHYDGLAAPGGADISSRKKHREYMKRTGLTTADDFKETWAKAKVDRERYYQQGGSVRKQDIREAIERLQSKR
jgi:hypothetical protein